MDKQRLEREIRLESIGEQQAEEVQWRRRLEQSGGELNGGGGGGSKRQICINLMEQMGKESRGDIGGGDGGGGQDNEREIDTNDKEDNGGSNTEEYEHEYDEYRRNLLIIDELERKFAKLARNFRKIINFFGLAQDVCLLLVDNSVSQAERIANKNKGSGGGFDKNGREALLHEQQRAISEKQASSCQKWFWFALIVIANSLTVYMLIAHTLWEILRMDAKMPAALTAAAAATVNNQSINNNSNNNSSTGATLASTAASASAYNGWLILKNFLENLRRHLLRYFAVIMIFTWHKNCTKFELLFVDCRRYYATFYSLQPERHFRRSVRANCGAQLKFELRETGEEEEEGEEELENGQDGNMIAIKDRQVQLIESTSKLYKLASRRVLLALCVPLLHLAFNLIGVFVAPRSLIILRSSSSSSSSATNQTTTTSSSQLAVEQLLSSNVPPTTTNNSSLIDKMLYNFNCYHSAVRTSFHLIDYLNSDNGGSGSGSGGGGTTQSSSSSSSPFSDHNWLASIPARRSALYCLLELFGHYIYIHGPRIICATCMSLILAIHQQCLKAFNRHLGKLIKRARECPLTRWDMVKLLKQYDMIGMMHERIELTFKWSLVLWFSLMFVSCLMLIFTLTESSSAVLNTRTATTTTTAAAAAAVSANLATTTTAAAAPIAAAKLLVPPTTTTTTTTPPSLIEGLSPVAIMMVRIAFACYAPWLIYSEAFKIEAESYKSRQLVMMLARRHNDPVAQAIEPSLFEPMYLSVGGYFNLSKRSVASLFGAIVTFSIMLIELRTHDENNLIGSARSSSASILGPSTPTTT